jgi:Concanavalin A-like lectin/glucanases superfamily/FecR protein
MKSIWKDLPDDLPRVLSELVDGSLAADDRERLSKYLADDADALDDYCRWMQLHAFLSLDFQHSNNLAFSPPLAAGRSKTLKSRSEGILNDRGRWWTAAVLIAVAASVILVVSIFVGKESGISTNTITQAMESASPGSKLADDFNRMSSDSVAVLASVADATGSGVSSLTIGAPVPAGRFALKSGLVQLEFLSGANVVVEGPAELELKSTKLIVCHRGKLRVRVPEQAKGFSVDTPHHRAVDLGTEFAVSVGEGNASEVHVFQGRVELFDLDKIRRSVNSSASETLRFGAGLRTSGDGSEVRIAADSDEFIDVERMLKIQSKEGQSRYSTWQQQSKRWQSDPHVVLYYGFNGHKPSSRVLHNDGLSKLASLDGAIVGCRWTEGRWPGKVALEFKGVEDRVRLNIPGEFRSITLSCWIRIDGFDRRLGSIFLTDGHDVGEPHWQFTNTGQLLLGVEAEHLQSQEYLSGSVLRPTDLGRWIHIACVYDDEKLEVAHFIDGQRVYSSPITKRVPLRFGPVELGNWVPEDLKNDRIRNLNGRVDEFLLLDRSVSDDEVRAMYVAGRPNG